MKSAHLIVKRRTLRQAIGILGAAGFFAYGLAETSRAVDWAVAAFAAGLVIGYQLALAFSEVE